MTNTKEYNRAYYLRTHKGIPINEKKKRGPKKTKFDDSLVEQITIDRNLGLSIRKIQEKYKLSYYYVRKNIAFAKINI